MDKRHLPFLFTARMARCDKRGVVRHTHVVEWIHANINVFLCVQGLCHELVCQSDAEKENVRAHIVDYISHNN